MKVGLQIMDFKKTQVMIIKCTQNRDAEIKIENKVIEHVNNYVYLGQQVSTNLSMKEEIKRGIKQGWKTFGRASSIFYQTYQ